MKILKSGILPQKTSSFNGNSGYGCGGPCFGVGCGGGC